MSDKFSEGLDAAPKPIFSEGSLAFELSELDSVISTVLDEWADIRGRVAPILSPVVNGKDEGVTGDDSKMQSEPLRSDLANEVNRLRHRLKPLLYDMREIELRIMLS